MEKECLKCNLKKLEIYFVKGGYKGKTKNICKDCYNSNWKYRIMSSISARVCHQKMYNGRIRTAKITDHNINNEFLELLKEKQNGKCFWLNIDIDFTMKNKLLKPSLDRLNNEKGYFIDNVVLTTVFANTGRRDANISEMNIFLSKLKKSYEI